MSSWTNTFNAVFFISAGTLITTFLGMAVKTCLKSKCEHFSCCYGLFSIDRRVDLELQAEMKEIELEEGKHHDVPSQNQL
jgi:recombinational DNA repair protein RecT